MPPKKQETTVHDYEYETHTLTSKQVVEKAAITFCLAKIEQNPDLPLVRKNEMITKVERCMENLQELASTLQVKYIQSPECPVNHEELFKNDLDYIFDIGVRVANLKELFPPTPNDRYQVPPLFQPPLITPRIPQLEIQHFHGHINDVLLF